MTLVGAVGTREEKAGDRGAAGSQEDAVVMEVTMVEATQVAVMAAG